MENEQEYEREMVLAEASLILEDARNRAMRKSLVALVPRLDEGIKGVERLRRELKNRMIVVRGFREIQKCEDMDRRYQELLAVLYKEYIDAVVDVAGWPEGLDTSHNIYD